MNRNSGLYFLIERQRVFIHDLINGADRQFLPVNTEYPVAVGTGDDHFFYTALDEKIMHFLEHGPKILFPSQVVGNFHAAVKDDAEGGSAAHLFPAHLQEQLGRVELFWANDGT